MNARRAWRWITGGPKPLPPARPGYIQFYDHRAREGWNFRLSPCSPAGLAIGYARAPNFIHRAMQRLLLGFTWEML